MLREHRLFIGEYHSNIVASLLLHRRIHADILGDAWNCINSSASLLAHFIFSECRGRYDSRYWGSYEQHAVEQVTLLLLMKIFADTCRYSTTIRLSVGTYSAKFGNTSPMHRQTHCWRKINRDCSAMHPCLIAGSTANIGVHTPLLFCGRDIRRMFGLYRAMSTDASAIMRRL